MKNRMNNLKSTKQMTVESKSEGNIALHIAIVIVNDQWRCSC
jgi:hypothetical protein